jgi:phage terminase large subunit
MANQEPLVFNLNISEETFLPVYRPLLYDADQFDIDFLYGGRDSGKSRHVAMQLILDCLRLPYFRCVLCRKVANTIKESQWQLIKDIVDEWGLTQFFDFKVNPLEIVCKNGNKFICRGLDEPARLKSISNPSHCWVEEGNQIDNTDFVTILTTLRFNEGNSKTWFTFNPECEVTYTEFWLFQEFFAHTSQLTWTKTQTIDLPNGKSIVYNTRATHSTYKDNRYCSPQRQALYESYKNSKNNQYWYQTYTLGLWGYRSTGGKYWKCFDEVRHVHDISYNKNQTIHVSVDNNRLPYIAISVWQVEPGMVSQIHELACESPNNTATKAAQQLVNYLRSIGYNDTVFLYGDPSANAKNTIDDAGRSFFDKFISTVQASKYYIANRVGRKAPGVSIRGAFINEIYESELYGWKIRIGSHCRKSIEDYLMVKEDKDGTMMKKRETDKDTKQSFERYGHLSDVKAYFIVTVLADEFIKYKSRKKKGILSAPQ